MRVILAGLCFFFFSFTALVVLVFFAGNFQGFTTATQMQLLDIMKYSAFLSVLAGLVFLTYLLVRILRFASINRPNGREGRKTNGKTYTFTSIKRRKHDIVFAVLALSLGLGALFVSQFIIVITLPKL